MNLKGIEVKIDRKKQMASILLPHIRKIKLCNLALPKGAKYSCRFIVSGGKGYENGLHQLAIGQAFEDLQVGRVTWALKTKSKKR
jgi:hypothetical protein